MEGSHNETRCLDAAIRVGDANFGRQFRCATDIVGHREVGGTATR